MKKLPALLASAALALTGLAAAPQTASAAAICVIEKPTITNKQLIVGTGNDGDTSKIKVKVTNCSPTTVRNKKVNVWWYSPEENTWANVKLKPRYLGKNSYEFTGSQTLKAYDMQNWAASIKERDYVYLYNGDKEISKRYAGTRDFQRKSNIKLDVMDENPKKGWIVTTYAPLQRANWETNKYGGYGVKPLVFQFRAKNSDTYKNIKVPAVPYETKGGTMYSGVPQYVKITVDGCYRVKFAGNSTTAPSTSKPDCIDVR